MITHLDTDTTDQGVVHSHNGLEFDAELGLKQLDELVDLIIGHRECGSDVCLCHAFSRIFQFVELTRDDWEKRQAVICHEQVDKVFHLLVHVRLDETEENLCTLRIIQPGIRHGDAY